MLSLFRLSALLFALFFLGVCHAAGNTAPATASGLSLAATPLAAAPAVSNRPVVDTCNDFSRMCSVQEHMAADPKQWLHWGEALLVCGALLMMSFYHLAIYGSRRNNQASLFLAVYCLLRTVNALCSSGSDWAIWLFLPNADPDTVSVVGMASLRLSFPFLQAFFYRLFPRQFPRWGLWGLTLGSLYCLLAGLYTGEQGQTLNLFFFYMLLVSVYSVVNLLRAWHARETGALILLAGYLILVLSGINDVLLAKEIIHTLWLAPIGTLVFILSQSALLAYRFSQAFFSAESLSVLLEKQNTSLQAEISERNRLEQKLQAISEEERRFVSRALHDGLCQELTAARLHCSLLQSAGPDKGNTAEIAKLSTLLESAVDQAYELSHGLWPIHQEVTDLHAALRELTAQTASEHGIDIALQVNLQSGTPSSIQNEHLMQIAKETLKNIVKHAKARHVQVSLLPQGDGPAAYWQLVIEDDGIGLGARGNTPGGLGTKIMAHHAFSLGGTLTLALRPEGGTRVQLSLPRPAQFA